ncbi:MAG TPA: RNA methyltransferase [Candidatus Acidoferrales bacterium]|nr:RNA methyltransferase [Candidatus Acidoferrales bacterium]
MPVRVILVEPEKAGNIGAVARSMKNFALSDLWIVNPKTPLTMEARAFAMHGYDILQKAKKVKTIKEAIQKLNLVVGTSAITATSRSNITRIPITPADLAQRIATFEGRVGIVFGRESSGLSNQEIEYCDLMLTIPANQDYNVLNIASAAAIIFYELFRTRTTRPGPPLASDTVRTRMLNEFSRLVKRSRIQRHKRNLVQRSFRNVISRSFITRREASLLVGLFRKASNALI